MLASSGTPGDGGGSFEEPAAGVGGCSFLMGGVLFGPEISDSSTRSTK